MTDRFYDKLAGQGNTVATMTVWVELQNGTKHIYTNLNRIIVFSDRMDVRGGVAAADKRLMA